MMEDLNLSDLSEAKFWTEVEDVGYIYCQTYPEKKVWIDGWDEIDLGKFNFADRTYAYNHPKRGNRVVNGIALLMGTSISGKWEYGCLDFDGWDAVVAWYGSWENVVKRAQETRIEYHLGDKGRIHEFFKTRGVLGNGKHFVIENIGKDKHKIEVRIGRELVFAWPSVHPSGEPWVPLDTDRVQELNARQKDDLWAKARDFYIFYTAGKNRRKLIQELKKRKAMKTGDGIHYGIRDLAITYYLGLYGECAGMSDDERKKELEKWVSQQQRYNQNEIDNIWTWVIETFESDRDKSRVEWEDGAATNPKKQKTEVHYIHKYSQNVPLSEAAIIAGVPKFVQLVDGQVEFTDKLQLEPKLVLKPKSERQSLAQSFVFKSEDEIEYYLDIARSMTNLDPIFKLVKKLLIKYIDTEDHYLTLLAADIIFTYFQDKFGTTHYIMLIGDNSSGKNSILITFAYLSYRMLLATAMSAANVYTYLDSWEIGQGTIAEDEVQELDEQPDKLNIYKSGYSIGSGRVPKTEISKTKGRTQEALNTYCFKVFAAEKSLRESKARGLLDRSFEIKMIAGKPRYNIKDIYDDCNSHLKAELDKTRKLLFAYRLLHYNNSIKDIGLTVINREKELTKPVIRLFQDSPETLKKLLPALDKCLAVKRTHKDDSLESKVMEAILELVKDKNETEYELDTKDIIEKIKELVGGSSIDGYRGFYSEDLGYKVSNRRVTDIIVDKIKGVRIRDGRGKDKKSLIRLTAADIASKKGDTPQPLAITPLPEHNSSGKDAFDEMILDTKEVHKQTWDIRDNSVFANSQLMSQNEKAQNGLLSSKEARNKEISTTNSSHGTLGTIDFGIFHSNFDESVLPDEKNKKITKTPNFTPTNVPTKNLDENGTSIGPILAKGARIEEIKSGTLDGLSFGYCPNNTFKCASFDCEWDPDGKIVCMCVVGSDNQSEGLHIDNFGGNQDSFIKHCLEALKPYPLLFGYAIKSFKKQGKWENSDIGRLKENAIQVGLLSEFTEIENKFVDCYNIFNNLNIKTSLAEQGITYREKSLESVSQAVLSIGKIENVKGIDAWKLPPDQCIEYCQRDAEIPLQLMARNNWEVLTLLFDISEDVHLDFITTANAKGPAIWWGADFQHAGIDNPYTPMTEWVTERIVVDKQGKKKRPSYNGAVVLPSKPGRHKNILLFDFESMYPSQFVKHNLDPLTFICSHEDCKQNNKIPQDVMDSINQGQETRPIHYWICKERGYLPQRMTELIKQKGELKKAGNKTGAMSKKLLINSLYGVFANPYFSHFNLGIAETVTAFARQTLYQVKGMLENMGMEVIYGDTDSLFIDTKDNKLSPGEIITLVKEEYKVNLELKTIWNTIQFGQSNANENVGKQKCYIGVTSNGIVESKTFAGEQVNRPRFFTETIQHLKTKEMLEGPIEDVVNYIKSRVHEIQAKKNLTWFARDYLAFNKKSNKPLYEASRGGWEQDIFAELVTKHGLEGAKSLCEGGKVYAVWKVQHDKKRQSKFSLNPDCINIDFTGYLKEFWTAVRDFAVGLDKQSQQKLREYVVKGSAL